MILRRIVALSSIPNDGRVKSEKKATLLLVIKQESMHAEACGLEHQKDKGCCVCKVARMLVKLHFRNYLGLMGLSRWRVGCSCICNWLLVTNKDRQGFVSSRKTSRFTALVRTLAGEQRDVDLLDHLDAVQHLGERGAAERLRGVPHGRVGHAGPLRL